MQVSFRLRGLRWPVAAGKSLATLFPLKVRGSERVCVGSLAGVGLMCEGVESMDICAVGRPRQGEDFCDSGAGFVYGLVAQRSSAQGGIEGRWSGSWTGAPLGWPTD